MRDASLWRGGCDSIVKKFLRFFVRGGKAVAQAAKTPIGQMMMAGAVSALPFGNLAHTVLSAVVGAEEEFGRGNGDDKMAFALRFLSATSPQVVTDFERHFGRELINEDRFGLGIQKLAEAYTDIASAFGVMSDEGKSK